MAKDQEDGCYLVDTEYGRIGLVLPVKINKSVQVESILLNSKIFPFLLWSNFITDDQLFFNISKTLSNDIDADEIFDVIDEYMPEED